jgi:hypothetical protein
MTVMLAAGVLLLATGVESARADQNRGHRHNHQHAYQGKGHGYGWQGQQRFGGQRYGGQRYGGQRHGGHAYGKRARSYHGGHLTKHQRQKLRHLRYRFDNERQFRRYLRHNKPRLFDRYVAHNHFRHGHAFDHRRYRAQRYVWTRHRAY